MPHNLKSAPPKNAFILAAGKGTRLRPHTNNKPKPMVCVHDKPIIHHILDKLVDENIQNVTINTSYLGHVIEDYLGTQITPPLYFSHEDELLETGGGVKKALHTMKDQPFFLINGDAFWVDPSTQDTALKQLIQTWDESAMDILLLLQPVDRMKLTQGVGDYHMSKTGQLTRAEKSSGDYMFTGIRIVHPRVFNDTPDGFFSFLECMDKAQGNSKLFGVSYNGDWHHISTPEDLENVNSHSDRVTK